MRQSRDGAETRGETGLRPGASATGDTIAMARATCLGEMAGGVYHGGDLTSARKRFPDAPEPWIDLSTGINRQPYPLPPLPADCWTRLPAASEIAGLEATAAGFFGALLPACVVATPGTQAIIQMLPRLIPARTVAILGFTYQEHATVWRRTGADVREVADPADLLAADVGIIVNPNNPDGRSLRPETLAGLADRMAAAGRTLVVDEAFMDLAGASAGVVPLMRPGLVVLRSFGKTWGLAGLRLGFVATLPDRAARFRAEVGPWGVSGAAIEIGRRAYADREWLAATAERLSQEASRLDALLDRAGFEMIGGTTLFRLARHDAAGRWFEHLARAGILTRPFPARSDWLRLGLPGTDSEWLRLEAALAEGIGG